MKSIGKILLGGKPANASTGGCRRRCREQGPEKSLLRATSAPSLKKACVIPKWLAHELLQERNAAQAHEDWRRDVTERLQQIRRKPSLNDALNALVYQLKRDNLTEGELFARIDADSDGELSRLELQVALRKLGVSLSTSELDGILRIFDSDGSGSTDFSEFYHLIKSQEDHLPDNYGTDENQGREKLHGYTVGERVKLRLCMSNKALQLDAHADIKSLHGTIVGNGARSGTFLLQLEDTNEKLLVKPRQLSKTKPTKAAPLKRSNTFELA
ncbi:unnamed protein product [Effrenium voratum]|uniref:EF-hand domain-containing protein n=1 Tax=Effrenium voratum TaxID=2562239 RepID=A0AA36N1K0_9DINO|nr:unnamed protein product [Effrenium voratum]CAJ1449556.1 unnamed protein product [Effrenium voratum]